MINTTLITHNDDYVGSISGDLQLFQLAVESVSLCPKIFIVNICKEINIMEHSMRFEFLMLHQQMLTSRTKTNGLSTTISFSPFGEALKKTISTPVAAAPSVPLAFTSMTDS